MKTILRKLGIFIAGALAMQVFYSIISEITLNRSHYISLLTPLDRIIPFVPETVVIYVSAYVFWLVPILSKNISVKCFWKMILITGVVFILSSIGHLVVPSSYPRPEISDTMANWAEFVVKKVIYWVDPPNNTFPSLHVTTVAILIIMMRNKMSRRGYFLYCFWGVLIILSTLTVKQHYILDILAGLLIVFGFRHLMKKKKLREKIHRDIPDPEDIN